MVFLIWQSQWTGDLHVDCHHTVEDTGIVLGTAIREALERDREFASFTVI